MSKWTHTTYKYALKKNGSWSKFCLKEFLFKTSYSLSRASGENVLRHVKRNSQKNPFLFKPFSQSSLVIPKKKVV